MRRGRRHKTNNLGGVMSAVMTRGVVFVHSCPRALCKHVEWTLRNILQHEFRLDWTVQEAAENMIRTEVLWYGDTETGAKIASALRGWEHLRYEITQESAPGCDGGRWSHTPEIGIFYAQTDAAGDVVVSENRVRAALLKPTAEEVRAALDLALGQAWDDEIEPFRYAGAGVPVRWINRVG